MREHGPRAAGEEPHGEDDRREHEEELDPEVGADRVVADREHEADGRERERRRAAERALEQHRGGDRSSLALVPAGRLVDAHRVAADRGREHLAGRVRDEVRAHEPGQAVVDPADAKQPPPAPGHRPDGEDHDRDRAEEVPAVRVREDVQRLPDVDLPEDVSGAETGDDERREDPRPFVHLRERLGIGRAEAYVFGGLRRPLESLVAALAGREHGACAVGSPVDAGPLDPVHGRCFVEALGDACAGEEEDAGAHPRGSGA